jgi:hypothetical protein
MAFDKSGLARIGGGTKGSGGAPQVWTYRTNDALTTVDGAGYFDNGATTNTGMRDHMAVGDMIYVHATADTIPTFGIIFVNSNSTGIIDTSNTLTMGTIDSD